MWIVRSCDRRHFARTRVLLTGVHRSGSQTQAVVRQGVEGWAHAAAATGWVEARAMAQMKPVSLRATAVVTLPCGLPAKLSLR